MHQRGFSLSGVALAGLVMLAPPAMAGVCDEDCAPIITKISGSGGHACYHISATMDGGPGGHALKRSRQALEETIDTFRRTRPPAEGWMGRLRVTPMKTEPNPYVRTSVAPDLMLGTFKTKRAYTVCWRGVLAPAVCTSGAKVCK